MKINKLMAVDEFIAKFLTRSESEKIREAISTGLCQGEKINEKVIQRAIKLLKKWFVTKLYIEGRDAKEVKAMAEKFDFSTQIGIGFSIEEAIKKGDFTYGRFLNHLLLMLESKEREIKYLKLEITSQKENLLDYEQTLQDFIYNPIIPIEIKNVLISKFYWLRKTEEEELKRIKKEEQKNA